MNLDTAKAIFARHADQFITAYVFGSVAAGTADEHSDIDVILVRDTALPFFDRIREIMDLRLEFGAADLLIYTPAELDEMLAEEGRYFVKNAVRTACRIEGTQQRSQSVAQAALPPRTAARDVSAPSHGDSGVVPIGQIEVTRKRSRQARPEVVDLDHSRTGRP